MREIAAWESVLDGQAKADVGRLLARLELPPVIAAPPLHPSVGTLRVMLAVRVEEPEPEDDDDAGERDYVEGEDVVHDLAVLSALDGGRLRDGEVLATPRRAGRDRGATR